MRLVLLLPGLLLPAEIRNDTLFDLSAPALSLLLGRATRRVVAGDWLAEAFGLPMPLPAAALRRLRAETRKVDAGDTPSQEYLCLDPVHLRVAREGISLADPAELALTPEEAQALRDAVAPLFAEWGTLSASATGAWELALCRPLELATRPLPEAIGTPVDPRLPDGPDGRTWRRLLAEAQTLLHAHPVNRKREDEGRTTINSLWPWGFGNLPRNVAAGFNTIASNNPVLSGLARLTEAEHIAPAGFAATPGHMLACDARLYGPARALDAMLWRNRLLEIERDWLTPALAALKTGSCRELRIVGSGFGCPDTEFILTRPALWRFWRRPRPLTALQ